MPVRRSKEWWMKMIEREEQSGVTEIAAGVPDFPVEQPVQETARRLATVRRISDLQPIEGADKIEVATVDGWKCVVGKGEFKLNDLCVYFEIDSFIPVGDKYPHFEFLRKRAIKWNGHEGARIKTMKLRGQISQGLAMPLTAFDYLPMENKIQLVYLKEGDDVTAALDVLKWEAIIPAQLAGKVKGSFPSFIPKTDQDRVQNYYKQLNKLSEREKEAKFEITTKIDGSSMTVYLTKDGQFGVCSRNMDLVKDPENAYWKFVIDNGVEETIRTYAMLCGYHFGGIAFQGELYGPGIQGNKEKVDKLHWAIFDIYMIDKFAPDDEVYKGPGYLLPTDRRRLTEYLKFEHVPYLGTISFGEFKTIDDYKAWSKGPSVNPTTKREGVVFRVTDDPSYHFKCINEEWLLENE